MAWQKMVAELEAEEEIHRSVDIPSLVSCVQHLVCNNIMFGDV